MMNGVDITTRATMKKTMVAVMISVALIMGLAACSGQSGVPVKRPVKKVKKAAAAVAEEGTEGSAMLADLQETGYVYERRGRRDPFIPLIRPKAERHKKQLETGTLQSYDISEFKLVAIAKRDATYYALLVTPDNRSFTVRRGMRIGLNKGKVKEVSSDRVVLVEYSRDYRGELKPRQITLEFNKGEDR